MSDRLNYRPSGLHPAAGGGVKERLVNGFTGLVERLEGGIDKAPADIQPAARKAAEVAKRHPVLTMAGLAVGALMLTRGSRRR